MKAIVTGSSGQDGYYMSEYLIERGYDVCRIDYLYSAFHKNDEGKVIKPPNWTPSGNGVVGYGRFLT